MASIETANQSTKHPPHIEDLRRVWQQAMEDKSPGIPADEVLDRLERNYRAIADASGTGEKCE